jgi:alkanesulfonate monooxygenase SsuD/methylene tetrahydromethanopterin reductase-like flavin-dependent oxidoreductase (luciferase family)
VWFTEHHFVDDGYLPSWTPVAGAMAARTARVRFSSDICLLPFSNPVRLAEDLAVLDNLSGGRIEIGVGMGYAPHEFRGFGIPLPQRLSRMEEGLEVLTRCFTGERFSFHGKRYDFDDVVIRPRYVQPGGPPLWIAAMSKDGALRAARFGAHLLPQGERAQVLDPWRDAVRTAGRAPDERRVGIIRSCFVTDDPERDWPAVRAAERYRGEVEPFDPVPGHLPGAASVPFAELAPQGRFLPRQALRDRLQQAAEDRELVAYCGSGVTACTLVLAAEVAGMRARLYPGSWSEWSRRGLPAERG